MSKPITVYALKWLTGKSPRAEGEDVALVTLREVMKKPKEKKAATYAKRNDGDPAGTYKKSKAKKSDWPERQVVK